MRRWSAFYLSVVLAILYAGLGTFFLIPGVYHPFSTDTVNVTHAHLSAAGVFLACALLALIAGRFSRPAAER
jgi:hypothetical protein